MFVLRRTDGKYVAKPGSEKSYVTNLQDARCFPNRESADADRCVENEKVVDLRDILDCWVRFQ